MTPTLDINQLKADFTGRLVAPGDSDYDQLRTVFLGGIDCKPLVIIMSANIADVQKAISLAQAHDLPLAVRSGGHSSAGHSVCDRGIVLDLRLMKAMQVNSTERTVWAQTGLTAAELTRELDKQDFVLGFGDTGSVGIGGITLGGGIGFLVRKHGLTIDNLLAAEIITADGQLHQIDEEHEPDLFWAIRGGGGNFGVVTRFKYQLHSLAQGYGGMLFFPAQPEILVGFMKLSEQAPHELSSIINVMPCPPMPFVPVEYHGQLIMMAMLFYAGPVNEAEKVLAPFRALATPIADLVKPMRYHEMFPSEEGSYHPTALAETMFMKSVELATAKVIFDQLQASDAGMRAVQLRVLGGVMADVPVKATAFAHRQSKILTNVAAFYEGEADKPKRQAWVDETAGKLNQGDNGVYVGFLGESIVSRIHDAYPGETWERLIAIKRHYDPANFFHLNQNIHHQ
ncbi:FAD-linked oxidase [Microgenomates group bacterium RIFCSPLOWO2_01_FULL_47_10]|nr:MAG: FAD-linked oxidase [Microgenomates group bacterium RIFCSPLOWO2_01_FULL_47_10]